VGAAEAGEAVGGSGFLVGLPSEVHECWFHLYCVTNSHVVREGEGNSPVVRINTKDGDKQILHVDPDDWEHHPDGDEVAALSVMVTNPSALRYNFVKGEHLLTRELIEQHNIGPGDEAFMVGRFISHEGRQRNTPILRFGNLSMMPWEPITHPSRGITQESFLVEMRSLSGFSGSPVFVYIPLLAYRPGEQYLAEAKGPWLLGVDWGHLPVWEEIYQEDRDTLISERWVVKSNSGQTMVVPAWKLRELLDQDKLAALRREVDDEITRAKKDSPAILDVQTEQRGKADEPGVAHDTLTRDAFENALDRVSRPEKKPD